VNLIVRSNNKKIFWNDFSDFFVNNNLNNYSGNFFKSFFFLDRKNQIEKKNSYEIFNFKKSFFKYNYNDFLETNR
jgi:hypothetical protein